MNADQNRPSMGVGASAGTKYIQRLISERQETLLVRLKAPAGAEQFEEWVAWVFDWTLDVAKENCEWANETLARLNPDESWSDWTLAEGLQSVCETLGLPCDPGRNEQPYMLRKLFLLPLSGESLREYRTSSDDAQRPLEFLTPELWLLWCTKLFEIAATLDEAGVQMAERMKWAVAELRIVGYRMLAFAWPESTLSRIDVFKSLCDDLEVTSGLWDLASGQLTDPDTAALRAYLKGKR